MGNVENGIYYLAWMFVYVPLICISIFLIYKYVKNILNWSNDPDATWKNEPFGISLLMIPFGIAMAVLKGLYEILKKLFNIVKTKRTLLVGIISLVVFLYFSYYYLFGNVKYQTLVKYSKYINILLIGLGFLIVFFLLAVDSDGPATNEDDSNTWTKYVRNLGKKSGYDLFLLICLGLVIGILGLLGYAILHSDIASITSLWMLTSVVSIGVLFILFKQLKKLSFVKKLLQNKFVSMIYHFIFLIPCLFFELAEYIYKELKNAPMIAYKILFVEIILVTIFVIVPMIKKILYTKMHKTDGRDIILSEKIEIIDNEINLLDKEIERWESYEPKIYDENGVQQEVTTYSMTKKLWNYIFNTDLNNRSKEEELKQELINNGYDKSNGIIDLINYIQDNGKNIYNLRMQKKELQNKKEHLKKEEANIESSGNGKLLINNPHHLKFKRYTDDNNNEMNYQNLTGKPYNGDYHYNYSISCWVFIHSKTNYLDEYKSILNYNGKPNIKYNSVKNTLEISMESGNSNKVVYRKKHFKLQKWHNIVINYTGGVLDIFINSELVASYKGVVPYMSYDSISVGDKDGTSGAICNLVYFPSHMPKTRIDANYKTFKGKIPSL